MPRHEEKVRMQVGSSQSTVPWGQRFYYDEGAVLKGDVWYSVALQSIDIKQDLVHKLDKNSEKQMIDHPTSYHQISFGATQKICIQ